MGLFRNLHNENVGNWCSIIFGQAAVDNFIGYEHLKKIRHFRNKTIVFEEDFTSTKLAELKRQRIPLLDLTRGQFVPRESTFMPNTFGVLSSTQFSRRMSDR